jgi:hypothetical protein
MDNNVSEIRGCAGVGSDFPTPTVRDSDCCDVVSDRIFILGDYGFGRYIFPHFLYLFVLSKYMI